MEQLYSTVIMSMDDGLTDLEMFVQGSNPDYDCVAHVTLTVQVSMVTPVLAVCGWCSQVLMTVMSIDYQLRHIQQMHFYHYHYDYYNYDYDYDFYQVNSALHLSGVAKLSICFDWG